jgi:7-carboxy-7-deazaguanine synthase
MFSDTLQGEGVNTGHTATFLRVMDCTLNCTWCDSSSVWRFGNPYTITEVLDIWEEAGLVEKFRNGQHLILTGGSPVKQQFELIPLIEHFIAKYGFKPYVEIENESVLPPHPDLIAIVDCWNNSPKLESSGNTKRAQYKPNILKKLSEFDNSWFKFVITDDLDWDEIKRDFLDAGLIRRDQVILMPEGATREDLMNTRELTVDLAIREGVKYSDRLHVIIWNKKTGV